MCHQDCPAPLRGGAPVQTEDVLIDEQLYDSADRLPAFVARPDQTPAPGVVILHDVWGANEFYHDVALRLAAEGFVAMLPDLFFRQGPLPEQTREAASARRADLDQGKSLIDIRAAESWLATSDLTTGAVSTIGFCMGGTLAMLAAGREPVPAATVAFYGFPVRERTPVAPKLPIDDDELVAVASPMLLLWGDQDSGVGVGNMHDYGRGLKRYGKAHEIVIYEGIGHGFLTFDASNPAYQDAQDAWRRTLAFIRQHSQQPEAAAPRTGDQ